MASVASVASACGTTQNTRLDPRIMLGMVKQLHELEKEVAKMVLQLKIAGALGHGLQPAPNNHGDHVKTGSQRFQNQPQSMWL